MSMITDRLPTADDGDADGDVCMKRRPNSPDNDTTMVHWSHVKQGVPWRHTFCWKPKRKPAPVTPDLVNQGLIELANLEDDLTRHGLGYKSDAIRAALERLKELEQINSQSS